VVAHALGGWGSEGPTCQCLEEATVGIRSAMTSEGGGGGGGGGGGFHKQ
jgi:hypothetical protein